MERFNSEKWMRQLMIVVLDVMITALCGLVALWLRFDFRFGAIPTMYMDTWLRFLPVQCIVTVVVFVLCRMYHYVWRTVGANDVMRMFLATLANCVIVRLAGVAMRVTLPRSVWAVIFLLSVVLYIAMRVTPRFASDFHNYFRRGSRMNEDRILLIGGGSAGRMLVQEALSSTQTMGRICAIIDDNQIKWGKFIEGVRIVGGRDKIPEAVEKYGINQIVVAMPSASHEAQRRILEACRSTGCRVRILPGISQVANGEVSMSAVRDVQIEDLLGRDPVRLDTDALQSFLGGKVIMVTGGGGSIGSELCRQIAKYDPKALVIVDIYENNAYDIQQELRRQYGDRLDLHVEIASVRDKMKVYHLFEQYHPQIVFHAAAHKHVPLMENCCTEAVKNNIFGTYHVVRAAEKYGAEKFVMISTDKAVNPTNIMGATKRFCEMVLQSRFDSPTEYCAVRFGNVLGSNGSVVPLFKRQIAEGGPITLTDKRIIRYFMTIPEAVSLVLQAGAMAKQGQVFVLDMGEPVRILDLAENLIRLSGLRPYVDIDVKEVGLRPGEKLYEELLIKSNDLIPTNNSKIFVEQQTEIDRDAIMAGLEQLDSAVTLGCSNDQMIALMRRLVPTYHSPEEVNAARAREMAREQAAEDAAAREREQREPVLN